MVWRCNLVRFPHPPMAPTRVTSTKYRALLLALGGLACQGFAWWRAGTPATDPLGLVFALGAH